MTPESKPSRKQILLDPVSLFSSAYPVGKEKQINTLRALWQELQGLKKKHKDIGLQARSISRKIGAMKRKGGSIDLLKAHMQEQSSRLKAISDKIGKTEKQILEIFDSEQPGEDKDTVNLLLDPVRTYPSLHADYDAVSVSLLDNEQHEWNAYIINSVNITWNANYWSWRWRPTGKTSSAHCLGSDYG